MKAILKLMRKQESLSKWLMKLMREIIKLYDCSVELQMLTDDLGMMELQFPITEV